MSADGVSDHFSCLKLSDGASNENKKRGGIRFGEDQINVIEARDPSLKRSALYSTVTSDDNIFKIFPISREQTIAQLLADNALQWQSDIVFVRIGQELETISAAKRVVLLSKEETGVDPDVFDNFDANRRSLALKNNTKISQDQSDQYDIFLSVGNKHKKLVQGSALLYQIPSQLTAVVPAGNAVENTDKHVSVTYLEHESKFWELTVQGLTHTTRTGKIGNKGRTTTKDFDEIGECLFKAEKAVMVKQRAGWLRQGQSPLPPILATTAAEPATTKKKSAAAKKRAPPTTPQDAKKAPNGKRSDLKTTPHAIKQQKAAIAAADHMLTKYLENRDTNRFWEVVVKGPEITVFDGAIGGDDKRSARKTMESSELAERQAKFLVAKYHKQGYTSWAKSVDAPRE